MQTVSIFWWAKDNSALFYDIFDLASIIGTFGPIQKPIQKL